MTAPAAPATAGPALGSREAVALARRQVREVLTSSAAFRALPPERQREIARHTVEVAAYLAEPDGLRVGAPGLVGVPALTGSAGAPAASLATAGATPPPFVAQGAREGAAVAGALLQAVNFPTFVSSLVQGVFHAIVQSSIEQMEAYGKLVADVAKTLNQYRDENVSPNQGRDHLVEQFPDVFALDMDTGADGAQPRVRVRDGVDETTALKRINSLPVEGGPLTSLGDDDVEAKLVPAARTQLATSRQQLLATTVLMGINRIVVTDGKIQAKVLYDFQARDNYRYQTSATQFDYGDQYATTGEGQSESQLTGAEHERSRKGGDDSGSDRDASYYSKGTYKYTRQPVLTLASASTGTTDAALSTKASLAGIVDINFKSDYLPLEKMADSFQIAALQQAAKPGRGPAASGVPAAGAPAAVTRPAAP